MAGRRPEDDPLAAPTEPRSGSAARGASDGFIVMWPGGTIERALPKGGAIVLGRAADSGIVVDHASISRRHVALSIEGGRVFIEDLGSTNGTVVDGAHLAPGARAPLAEGGIAQFGDAVLSLRRMTRIEHKPAGGNERVVVLDESTTQLHRMIDLVAKSHVNVLVHGETGTGKEVVAESIHRASNRAAKPFIGINVAALPENLLETELFGYEKGAFTGANAPKQGLLEAANGGTAFLDEIAEMPLAAQAKLLRVLEKREVMRVGSVKVTPIDVRFVAATHHDLRQRVAEGKFREDLFFRLDGITLEVPPLRERPKELAALATRFLDDSAASAGRPRATIAEAALARLREYDWPGNVRELRNVMDRAFLLAVDGNVRPEHIVTRSLSTSTERPAASASVQAQPPPPRPSGQSLSEEIADLEQRRIIEALDTAGGNQTEAAKILGMPRRTLIARIEAYGIRRPRKK